MDDTLCKYPSRNCQNPRSLKISGELHRFCITHRRKANAAQRRWTLKRRAGDGDGENQVHGNRKRVREDSETGSSDEEGSIALLKVPRVETRPYYSLPELHAETVDAEGDGSQAPLLSDDDFTQLCALFLDADETRIIPDMNVTAPVSADCWWDPRHAGFHLQQAAVSPTEWQF